MKTWKFKNNCNTKGNKNRNKASDDDIATAKDYIYALLRIVLPASLVLVVCNYIILPTSVMSGSMEPTLNVGQLAVYNRLAYVKEEIKRGDIISFYSDELDEELAKRVIGIPGDEISFQDGCVVINGHVVDESDYIPAGVETNCSKTFNVPAGCVFVLGDNREYSYDSRNFMRPYISMEKIDGKFMGQYGPSVPYYLRHSGSFSQRLTKTPAFGN